MSSALAARICACRARIASAMAASALSFCAVGASASTRAALFARAPVSRSSGAMFDASTVLSGAVMARSVFLAFVLPCSRQSREAGFLATCRWQM
jgi:hypothetical protein